MAIFDLRFLSLTTILWFIILYPSYAQDRPNAREQAFSTRIITEVNANLSCTTELITLQERLAKVEAELKSLKEAPKP